MIDAEGDGLDSNGGIVMTGGVVLVNGPTNNGNGAMDYNAGFNISGGFLVAVGSSGMAMAPDQTSSQNSLLLNFNNVLSAGTLIHIQNSAGEDILTFAPTKQIQSVALSSPDLVTGETYEVFTGGSSTGTNTDGLFEGGSYSGGTSYTSFTVSSVVTAIGSTGMMGGMGGGGKGGGRTRP